MVQLNRQRQWYEMQLKLLQDRRQSGATVQSPPSADASSPPGASSLGVPNDDRDRKSVYMQRIIQSLKAEKRRLIQQSDNLRGRLKYTKLVSN